MNASAAKKSSEKSEPPECTVHPISPGKKADADWEGSFWSNAETLDVKNFRPESSDHRPRTRVRLLYDPDGIHGIFNVEDRYVRCVRTNYHDEVWKDSCVEFFARPKPKSGYFNFEFNCGGAFLVSYIINPERTPNGFKDFTKVPWETARGIQVQSSLPKKIQKEMEEPVVWTLRFFIPFSLFEGYVGALGEIPGQIWRGNFYKCAEDVSHPHWAAWAKVDEFNFHLPRCFGRIAFA